MINQTGEEPLKHYAVYVDLNAFKTTTWERQSSWKQKGFEKTGFSGEQEIMWKK